MKFEKLIKNLKMINGKYDKNIDITGIAYDSRKVKKGFLFVCIDGIDEDGHTYINNAKEKGAIAVIISKDTKNTFENVIKVKDSRETLALVSATFYNNPSKSLNVVGITGTKGKTTIAKIIKEILDSDNKQASLSGTLGMFIGNQYIKTKNTTPSSLDLQQFFSKTIEVGLKYSIMEVASIALKQKRVSNIDFDYGIYTNLAKTHIGKREHVDFYDYLKSKAKLFKLCKKGIINIDDKHYKEIIKNSTSENITYSVNNTNADIYCENIISGDGHSSFTYVGLGKKFDVTINMPGTFNISNAIAAITVSVMLKASEKAIKEGLLNVKVKGRCEILDTNTNYKIMIDYAHNQSSLEKLLSEIREGVKGKVICLFGCGGDRDNEMRYDMGEISGTLADFTIITSDNPRTEEPKKIIDMIEEGIKKTKGKYICIENRTEAISYAIDNAAENDLVILAGKGHETYVEINKIRSHYDEREVVSKLLQEKKID